MLSVKNLTFGYTDRPLFENVTFLVARGQKVGLVGPNGAGKSTLLSLLLGKDQGNSGSIDKSGTIAYVPQEIKRDVELENASSVKAYIDPENHTSDYELLRLFKGLELSVELSAAPQKLSGGQKTKIALAKAILSNPDVLLLDEPTNFMDTQGKHWLMNFLSDYQGAVLVISHDLNLMDRAIDKVLALNPATKTIDEYKGNYTQYLKLKAEKEELLKRQILIKEKHIKQMEEGLKKMARFTSGKGVRRRIQQKRRIEKEKEALPDAPPEIRKITVKLPEPASVGELPIRAFHISKSFGEKTVLKDVNFTLKRAERVALIGPNGVGKSTFIKILMGMTKPDQGEIVKHEQLDIGYYSQEFETFNLEKTVIDTFMEATHKDERFTRAFLGRYLLSGDKVFQRVESLSGGEKTRLSIAMLTGRNHNMLILDEPTTYLDVMSQRIILEALKEYRGAMILVSHTPEFVIELKPNRAYLFPQEKEVYWDESLVSTIEEV